jgi:hypothetical protein
MMRRCSLWTIRFGIVSFALLTALLALSLKGSEHQGVAVAQVQVPLWVRYPHDDEHPCASDRDSSAGLRCQENAFEIATWVPCKSERDCPVKRVHFRDNILQTAPRCSANVCIYRPEPRLWCWHRRQLWDAPVVTERNCTFDRECPSGMTCGVAGLPDNDAKKIRGRCAFLPIFVWSPGTGFLEPEGEPRWPQSPPLPKNLPTIWDITVGPLPPAPHGYFWIQGAQFPCWWMTCRLGMGCNILNISHPQRYPATTYVLRPADSLCLPDEEHFDQALGLYDEVTADLE